MLKTSLKLVKSLFRDAGSSDSRAVARPSEKEGKASVPASGSPSRLQSPDDGMPSETVYPMW